MAGHSKWRGISPPPYVGAEKVIDPTRAAPSGAFIYSFIERGTISNPPNFRTLGPKKDVLFAWPVDFKISEW